MQYIATKTIKVKVVFLAQNQDEALKDLSKLSSVISLDYNFDDIYDVIEIIEFINDGDHTDWEVECNDLCQNIAE